MINNKNAEISKNILMVMDFAPNQNRTFETFLLRILPALRAENWRIVFIFSGEPSVEFAARIQAGGAQYRVAVFPLQREGFEAIVASLRGTRFLAMTNTFLSCFDPFLLQLRKRLGIRYWIVHDESSGVASEKTQLKRFLAKLRGWYYGLAIDRIMAVSEFVVRRNIEQSSLPRSRVCVLRNGIDLSLFQAATRGLRPESCESSVVFVGQLIPEKGILTLLEALLILKRSSEPITPTLEVAGRGALEAELRAFVASNGLENVNFRGQVADVVELYRTATVVVVPSEWAEAAAFVITEAMACGACVLASDAGGNPDLIGTDQEAGRLFRSGDAADLAGELRALLGDPSTRARLGQGARARAERLFDLDEMVRGFVGVLREVTGSSA